MPDIVIKIFWILFYLLTPALVIHFSGRYLLFRKAGHVIIVYAFGLIVGNTGLIPEHMKEVQDVLSSVTILLALPLLLMSLDISSWTKMAGRTFMSLVLGIGAVLVSVIAGFFVFHNHIPEAWKVAGMLIGVYSGGTPNLASLQGALQVNPTTYLFVHTADLMVSALYLLFLMTLGRKVFNRILPFGYHYKGRFESNASVFNAFENYEGMFEKHNLIPSLGSAASTILILVLGFGASKLFPEQQTAVAILVITSLGIATSQIPTLKRAPKNFEMGMYLILVFSLTVSSMADVKEMHHNALPLLGFVGFVVFVSLILHALLSRIFKLDPDTMMITSTALICSPPFVPVVAGALNNRDIIISGISVGIVGYAIGNYLGIFIAYLLL
jgi:uncharacterized membrane protein